MFKREQMCQVIVWMVLGVFFVTIGSGCSSSVGNKRIVNKKYISQVVEGKTTKDQVRTLLGEPNSKADKGDSEVLHYTFSKTTSTREELQKTSIDIFPLFPILFPLSFAFQDKTINVDTNILINPEGVVSKIKTDKTMMQNN